MQAVKSPTQAQASNQPQADTIDPVINGIIAELQSSTPVYEMEIDGNAYVCPLPSQATVKEYDAWIDYVKRHPVLTVPKELAKRPRKANRWLRMAHYVRRASFAAYWWGIPQDIAILLPAEQMEAMVAAAFLTYCPLTSDLQPSIQIGKDACTVNNKALTEIDLRSVTSVQDFLADVLINEYGESPSKADIAGIPLDQAFAILRSIASFGLIGRQGSRTHAKDFLASIVYAL